MWPPLGLLWPLCQPVAPRCLRRRAPTPVARDYTSDPTTRSWVRAAWRAQGTRPLRVLTGSPQQPPPAVPVGSMVAAGLPVLDTEAESAVPSLLWWVGVECMFVCVHVCACLFNNLIVSYVLCRLNLIDGHPSTVKNNTCGGFRYGVGVHLRLCLFANIWLVCRSMILCSTCPYLLRVYTSVTCQWSFPNRCMWFGSSLSKSPAKSTFLLIPAAKTPFSSHMKKACGLLFVLLLILLCKWHKI